MKKIIIYLFLVALVHSQISSKLNAQNKFSLNYGATIGYVGDGLSIGAYLGAKRNFLSWSNGDFHFGFQMAASKPFGDTEKSPALIKDKDIKVYAPQLQVGHTLYLFNSKMSISNELMSGLALNHIKGHLVDPKYDIDEKYETNEFVLTASFLNTIGFKIFRGSYFNISLNIPITDRQIATPLYFGVGLSHTF